LLPAALRTLAFKVKPMGFEKNSSYFSKPIPNKHFFSNDSSNESSTILSKNLDSLAPQPAS